MPLLTIYRPHPGCLAWLVLLGVAFGSLGAEKIRRAVAPLMDPPAGFRDQPVLVSLRSPTPGATIYFTTNGSEPDARAGQVYREPITVAHTTVLRAVAVANQLAPSASRTATYLFLEEVRRQTGVGFPATWGTNLNQPVPADYEMDPEVANAPAYRDEFIPALRALPTLSIVMALPDLFDPQRGLYANPRQAGDGWERPASVELLHPDGRPGFQINCGLRIQGGWNRRPEESPKHSFRLVFKKRYGPGKLKFPLFGETGAREFDTLVLRSGCNNTWLHWSGEERLRGEFIRDQWMRDSFRAMGHASARGLFVHLYLNGLYWGLYNPCERPSAPFVAGHFGGQPED